jgi:Tol biopolymer transport system component
MKTSNIILIVILFAAESITAQTMDSINYLNQKPPGKVAEIFAPGIFSTSALEHAAPAFSPDGKTVLWSVMKVPSYQLFLLEMNFENGKWSSAHSPSFSDTTVNEVYPCFSPDGNNLYFSSDRITGPSSPRKNRLWYVNREATGWSEAKVLDTVKNENGIYANSIAGNWSRYLSIGISGNMDWNIFQSDRSGKIKALPSHINSKGYEDGPFIAPDESYLIFESDRPTTVQGNLDLYISFRKKNGEWTEPRNMGATINTNWAERFARVSPDGRYLFFGRNIGNGFDIYWISAAIIGELKLQAAKDGMVE